MTSSLTQQWLDAIAEYVRTGEIHRAARDEMRRIADLKWQVESGQPPQSS